MEKSIVIRIVLAFSLIGVIRVHGQTHIAEGQQYVNLEVGLLFNGAQITAGYQKNLTNKININPALSFYQGNAGFTNYNYYMLKNTLTYHLVQYKSRLLIGPFAGTLTGLEYKYSDIAGQGDMMFAIGYHLGAEVGLRYRRYFLYCQPSFVHLVRSDVLKKSMKYSIGVKVAL